MANTILLQFGNPYFRIVPSDNVEKGKAIVSEDLNYLCKMVEREIGTSKY